MTHHYDCDFHCAVRFSVRSARMASLLADALLDRLIGPYARLGERKLDLTGGSLVLRSLELREDALDGLGLPVAIRGGEIDTLEITVPWTKLTTDSVVIKLHQLSVLLSPVSESEWNEVTEQRCSSARKSLSVQGTVGGGVGN